MKLSTPSLRTRLLKVIIIPLMIFVLILTAIRYYEAQETAKAIYDKALNSIAHVIVRDVLLSEGDLLTERLLETLTEVLGDQIFYHVNSENGQLNTGYSNPPRPTSDDFNITNEPFFYNQTYNGDPVRAVTFREFISTTPYEGWVRVSVWQTVEQRRYLGLSLAAYALTLLSLLTVATALVVWFGVNYGLRPLTDLEEAINKRSPQDISDIQRAVPKEVFSLVQSMNGLFGRLRNSFAEKDAFIANAAHQLRNPIAGILSQAEAAEKVRDPKALHERVVDVANAVRHTARLTHQLLSVQRISGSSPQSGFEPFDVVECSREVLAQFARKSYDAGIAIELTGEEGPILVRGNPILLGEVLENLLDNALRYGSANGGPITTHIKQDSTTVTINVRDCGTGIPESFMPHIFERFTRAQQDTTDGCGLGLAIAQSIINNHQGQLSVQSDAHGTCVTITLPLNDMHHVTES